MRFRVLGSLEAEADGVVLRLGTPFQHKLFAALLLDAGRVVPLARLMDVLWDDEPPATGAKQVRNAVSRLRTLLAVVGARGLISTDGSGYRLALVNDEFDAREFQSAAASARRAAAAGRTGEAARLLRYALNLWRGPFLAGMSGRLIESAAASWNESRLAAAEAYYDHQLAMSQHAEVVCELAALVAEHPLREKPVGQLMLALYRCGRQADALAWYGRTRTLLADELGLDPGGALQRLHQQILADDPALSAPVAGNGERRAIRCLAPPVPRHLAGTPIGSARGATRFDGSPCSRYRSGLTRHP